MHAPYTSAPFVGQRRYTEPLDTPARRAMSSTVVAPYPRSDTISRVAASTRSSTPSFRGRPRALGFAARLSDTMVRFMIREFRNSGLVIRQGGSWSVDHRGGVD